MTGRKTRENSVSRGVAGEDVGSEIKFAGNDNKDKMYEPKHRRKLVRVFTVIGYVFSVSLAAIMLSLFYIFIYNPWKPAAENADANANAKANASKRLLDQHDYLNVLRESSDFLNETFSEIEKEEPRALPIEELKTTMVSKIKKIIKNK